MSEPKKEAKPRKFRKGPKPLPSRPRVVLVRLRKSRAGDYAGIFDVEERFVFLGVIRQMPGHCVLSRLGDGKLFTGFDCDAFEVIPKGE